MARIKPEDMVEHLSSQFRRALAEAVEANIPGAKFDERQLFLDFKRAVYRKCNLWETVPDRLIQDWED